MSPNDDKTPAQHMIAVAKKLERALAARDKILKRLDDSNKEINGLRAAIRTLEAEIAQVTKEAT